MRATRRLQLGRNVLVVSWVSFFQDAASEMLYPIIGLFLKRRARSVATIVGIVAGLADGTASLLKVYAGSLADRMARRPLVARRSCERVLANRLSHRLVTGSSSYDASTGSVLGQKK